ncbi:hypothetical protein [Salinisphaera sp. T31B1]|uniref:hypothetical protein n=1 Tax=Salinisphaera sp. T31B1 TaxID=727963 RepID=UPI003340DD21
MANIAEPWLKAHGFGTDEPDRIGAIAKTMAGQPTKFDRIEQARRLEKLHGRHVAEQIAKRAEQILRDRRQQL